MKKTLYPPDAQHHKQGRLRPMGAVIMAFALLCCVLACSPTAKEQAPANTFMANGKTVNKAEFDANMNNMLAESGIPAISVAIISDNQVVYTNQYGYKNMASKAAVDEATVFEAASLTKCFLTYVAHKLVQEGKLDLDKPMHEYLPHDRLAYDERYKQITPRMLLSHTSGIENWQYMNNPDTLEILRNPGEGFVYSGEGYQYLNLVIEQILGKTYDEYMEELVFKPFGLKHTYTRYDTTNNVPANYATGYSFFAKEIDKWKNQIAVPASGNHLPAADFAKMMIGAFNGENLTPATITQLTQPVAKMAPPVPNSPSMSLGYMTVYPENDTIISFGGSNDGYKAWVSYSTVSNSGLVFMTNNDIGVSALKYINELTVNLDLSDYLFLLEFPQYPSDLFPVLKAFNEGTIDDMLAKVNEINTAKAADGGIAFSEMNMLSSILFKGSREAALKLMEQNAELHPDNPEAFFNLAQINMAMNNLEKAYEYLKKCQAINPDYNGLAATLAQVEQAIKG